MRTYFGAVICLLLAVFHSGASRAQDLPVANPAKQSASSAQSKIPASADYSKQSFVQEIVKTSIQFQLDGTGHRHNYARFLAQSEAGVQQLGLIIIGYNSAFERLTIEFVHVVKPDGKVVNAPTSSIQDLPSEVQRLAPEYTDFRQKHINVPNLRPGDRLEYSISTEVHAAMVPSQFWTEYSFDRSNITLDEQFEVDLPASRKIRIKFAPEFPPNIREADGRKIYSWSHKNTKIPDPGAEEEAEPRPDDIQISSFQDWSEIGHWYAALERPSSAISEEVRAKSLELTKGLATTQDKVQAIYHFVASEIRYVGLSFGSGRFQPHAASEVLANTYGDCKDKHTLLAAMLESIGLKVSPVLISTTQKLDPDVPSPSQFNHVISAISIGSETIYADTTTEVAPLGFLVPVLRKKQALKAAMDGGELVTTVAAPPVPNMEKIVVDAHLVASGDLDAKITLTAHGDPELVWRSILRRTPEAQWVQILKSTLEATGLSGDVSEVNSTDPSDTSKPLQVTLRFEKPKYVDWATASKLTLPILKANVRPAYTPDQKKSAIRQGPPNEIVRELHLEFPAGRVVLPPVNTAWSEDFAEYKSTYKVAGNVLIAHRDYRTKLEEIPRSRYEEFNSLYTDMTTDEESRADLPRNNALFFPTPRNNTGGGLKSAEAQKLFESARSAWGSGNLDQAERDLQKLVKLNPKYPEAWLTLARVYSRRSVADKAGRQKAVDAYQRELAGDPKNAPALQELAMVLFMGGQFDEAAATVTKYLEQNPSARGMHWVQGMSLIYAGKPAEAIPPLEKATAESHDSAARTSLARAYFETGATDKALKTIGPIFEDSGVTSQAAAAIALADANVSLDRARDSMLSSLKTAYETLHQAEFYESASDNRTWKLIAIWEALGWVYWKQGDAPKAHRYLEASWSWSHQLGPGDHLARVYASEGKTEEAVRIWATALSNATIQHPEIKKRFVMAAGSEERAEDLIRKHRLDSQQTRTIEIPNTLKLTGTTHVRLLIGPGPKIYTTEFSDGDDSLMRYIADIKSLEKNLSLPDNDDIRVLREAVISCGGTSCTFVLIPPPTMLVFSNSQSF